MDITEFLLARIAEHEAWAHWLEDDKASTIRSATNGGRAAVRRYILAECEAKRRIVEMYGEWHGHDLPEGVSEGRDWDEAERDQWVRDALECALKMLAQPYADHPDYDPGWRP